MLPGKLDELADKIDIKELLESCQTAVEPVPTEAELEEARKCYVDYLVDNHRTVQMRGVKADTPVAVNLERLYVDLRIRPGVSELPGRQPIALSRLY